MSDMTISQALRKMAKLKADVAAWRARASAAVTFQEDSPPAYTFADCMEKAVLAQADLSSLKSLVAVKNATTEVEGKSLAFCLVLLQEMKGTLEWLKSLPVRAQPKTVTESRDYDDEGKVFTKKTQFICQMTEADRDAKVAEIQAQFDALNDAVETTNGRTLL